MTINVKQVSSLSFEEALMELEQIVQSLESGSAPLEQSITTYERGVELKKHCEKKLADAQMKIEKISIGKNGEVSTSPFQDGNE